MRRLVCLLTGAVLAVAGLATASPAAASTTGHSITVHSITAGHNFSPGQVLVSPHRTYHAGITKSTGRLFVARRNGSWVWATPRGSRSNAHLLVGNHGNVRLLKNGKTLWRTNTTGSGAHDVLRIGDNGVLTLTSGGARVWSSQVGNGCAGSRGKTFVTDLSRQLAWLCNGSRLQRATFITSGATAHGDGTPTGTWHVQHKIRDTTLYPAAGGAYHVHYWVPYDGAYGLHDSQWQHFAYGSSQYKTRGSHGCIHVPATTMAWFFKWARVGTTTVRIHR